MSAPKAENYAKKLEKVVNAASEYQAPRVPVL